MIGGIVVLFLLFCIGIVICSVFIIAGKKNPNAQKGKKIAVIFCTVLVVMCVAGIITGIAITANETNEKYDMNRLYVVDAKLVEKKIQDGKHYYYVDLTLVNPCGRQMLLSSIDVSSDLYEYMDMQLLDYYSYQEASDYRREHQEEFEALDTYPIEGRAVLPPNMRTTVRYYISTYHDEMPACFYFYYYEDEPESGFQLNLQ